MECVALDFAAEERAPFASGGAAGTEDAPVAPLGVAPVAGSGSGGAVAETLGASTVADDVRCPIMM